MSYLRPAKKASKHSRYIPPSKATDVDLGGLTFPKWTGRPHMGPGNRVMEKKSPYYGDEKYRQHDLGYSDMTNPYFNYNSADEKLLRSATEGPADVVGKGVFLAKKALDVFNTPTLYEGGYGVKKKDVNGKYYYDSDFVPFRDTMPYVSPDIYVPPPSSSSSSGARKKDFGWYDRTGRSEYSERSQFVDQPSSGGGGARGGSGRKHDYKVKYTYS